MTQITTPFCPSCGWDMSNRDDGTDAECDSCGHAGSVAGVIYPTASVAGIPGSFTPATGMIPKDLVHIQALGALGETTTWTTGQNVALEDASTAHWNGSAWASGAAA